MGEKSNLHIGSVGGNVSVGGDMVAGDKITTSQRSIININGGFRKKEDKTEFISQVNELRSMLKRIRSQIDGIEGFDKDEKEELFGEITQQVQGLKTAVEEADTVAVGQEAPRKKVEAVAGCLDKAAAFMEKLQKVGDKTVEFASKVTPLASSALTILINARKLFGLP